MNELKIKIFAIAVGMTTVAGAGVWSDALVGIRGAIDRNADGYWTATDYTSANTEVPDFMHAAEVSPSSARILNYYTVSHDAAKIRIESCEVKSAAANETVTRQVLYFPQPVYTDGETNAYFQALALFNGKTPPVTSENWSIIFRLKPAAFTLATSGSGYGWFADLTTTNKSNNAFRLGFSTTDNVTGKIRICAGDKQTDTRTLTASLSDGWIEVSLVVSGRKLRMSCGRPGALRRWEEYAVSMSGNVPANLQPSRIVLGSVRGGVQTKNIDAFRGWIDMVGVWNRTLTDAEVVEAFCGENPGLVRLGEEGASDRMFAGTQLTGEMILDPKAQEQRLWPASWAAGAVVKFPVAVNSYHGDMMQALRVVGRSNTARAVLGVTVDGASVGRIDVLPSQATFLPIAKSFLSKGTHQVALTCEWAAGAIRPDVVEIVGSWQVGDGTGSDVSPNSETSFAVSDEQRVWHDRFFANSANMKDYVYYLGGKTAFKRDKFFYWNVPTGLGQHAAFKLTYKTGQSSNVSGRKVQVFVNDGQIASNPAGGSLTYDVELPVGIMRDGLNEIRFSLDSVGDSTESYCNINEMRLEMTSCKKDYKSGMILIVR